ncbi:extracellular solute-binding protein [Rhodobacter sphaeroides]|jgi:Spermidine/putrescine-binding periplasmic protein|uniref:ABC permidine/putrescine transporter, periplasmic substrate-binding protein n=1 Tax=Cereibacter sphaeroides (strain ATCC 17023 / DSM 158 / JCM 6121 / CCUG 31486 / LMG 2827 / NBRC 12203 / NCIMB 8253 / ATH 2.4.1.) TaxID=272943 RepID=Q3IXS9_CERS4|nr:spermidine/putrescine ABC transporter substrate-binding protein [Cereibacter sphaeroides]ABA80655.1 ABC permidine/putrescine transporter, periplasmic substrate-binding protein [Cereibacter sphaeroides 2.4.1]AMJ48985.1 potassium transporter Trk [Cereibacter sphaeroides]ANS35701.1 potassium transporter Trk [Cereibacter sphaeroides]ATN64754.1 potassium transporter Trk [Cereibacter sphaeroides]AXC62948.1 spermidine/putrescine ABC transporter substrate-binding protein [Cereibacter sphaeroides 2.
MTQHRDHIPAKEFLQRLESYRKGSISRRHFLNVTGLGAATMAMAGAMPGFARRAQAQGAIGDRVVIATWPNYHDPADLDAFRAATGAAVDVNVFGSNEEMLAKLQAGGTGWDVVVATNYTISTYVEAGIIEELDLSRIPNFDRASTDPRFADPGVIDGKTYAIPRNIGTTGYCINTAEIDGETPTTWKEFWDLARDRLSGRGIVHDYQLTAIGNALKYYGYSFNSVDPAELAKAEELLIDAKPHLFAITSDYQPSMRSGDAALSMCWTGDAVQLQRDIPEIAYVLGREGGELWSDFFTIPASAPHKDAAYALINFLLEPKMAAQEAMFHGYPTGDARVDAMLPAEMRDSPILFPAADLLNALEFGAAVTLTNPERAEVMARFKSA